MCRFARMASSKRPDRRARLVRGTATPNSSNPLRRNARLVFGLGALRPAVLYGALWASYWPNARRTLRSPADLAFAPQDETPVPKVVLSRTLEQATWNNTRIVRDCVGDAISELKRSPGKPIVAWAGAGLVSTLAGRVRGRGVPSHRATRSVLGKGTPRPRRRATPSPAF